MVNLRVRYFRTITQCGPRGSHELFMLFSLAKWYAMVGDLQWAFEALQPSTPLELFKGVTTPSWRLNNTCLTVDRHPIRTYAKQDVLSWAFSNSYLYGVFAELRAGHRYLPASQPATKSRTLQLQNEACNNHLRWCSGPGRDEHDLWGRWEQQSYFLLWDTAFVSYVHGCTIEFSAL